MPNEIDNVFVIRVYHRVPQSATEHHRESEEPNSIIGAFKNI